jgi:cell shape-determining protein MreC
MRRAAHDSPFIWLIDPIEGSAEGSAEGLKSHEEQATEIERLKKQIAEKQCKEQAKEIGRLKKQLADKD